MKPNELVSVAIWKYRNAILKEYAENNYEDNVIKISGMAFNADPEWLGIAGLRCLHGVRWAMASAILHFAHNPFSTEAEAIDKGFPIFDVRVMRTIKVIAPDDKKDPPYSILLWKGLHGDVQR